MSNASRQALTTYARQVLAFGLLLWPLAAWLWLHGAGF